MTPMPSASLGWPCSGAEAHKGSIASEPFQLAFAIILRRRLHLPGIGEAPGAQHRHEEDGVGDHVDVALQELEIYVQAQGAEAARRRAGYPEA